MKFATYFALMAPFVAAEEPKPCSFVIYEYKDNTCAEADEQRRIGFTEPEKCDEFNIIRDIWWNDPTVAGEVGAANMLSGDGGMFPEGITYKCDETTLYHTFFKDKACTKVEEGLAKSTKYDTCFEREDDGKKMFWKIKPEKPQEPSTAASGATKTAAKFATAAIMALVATQFWANSTFMINTYF